MKLRSFCAFSCLVLLLACNASGSRNDPAAELTGEWKVTATIGYESNQNPMNSAGSRREVDDSAMRREFLPGGVVVSHGQGERDGKTVTYQRVREASGPLIRSLAKGP